MSSPSDEERLQRLLGGLALAGLRERLRARYQRGQSADEFTLTDLTGAERRALEDLLGRPAKAAGSMRVRWSEFDEVIVRGSLGDDFRSVLEKLDGPLHDRKAKRIALDEAWTAMLMRVEESRLRSLVADTTNAALLKRFVTGDPSRAFLLLTQAERVLARLPAQGIPLAQLAAEVLGDAHGLDPGHPVATIVLRACASAASLEGEERLRDQWARLGVSVNELAKPVLCLNLGASGDTPGAQITRVAAACGEPVHLTLRTLLRQPPLWDVASRTVYVCENAAIVAIAADRFGARSAPLVCTDGMPAAAQRTLLTQLVAHGAQLRFHADFDWPGLRIGNFIMRAFGAVPWRFSAVDYLAAHRDLGAVLAPSERVDARWDDGLADAMIERGRVVHEEAVVETLLQDL